MFTAGLQAVYGTPADRPLAACQIKRSGNSAIRGGADIQLFGNLAIMAVDGREHHEDAA